jgi:hypothetical protein
MDPRSGLDDVEKRKFLTLPGLELRPLGRSVRRQLLYRLSYPGSQLWTRQIQMMETSLRVSDWSYALKLKTEDVIVCCLITAIAHLGGGGDLINTSYVSMFSALGRDN